MERKKFQWLSSKETVQHRGRSDKEMRKKPNEYLIEPQANLGIIDVHLVTAYTLFV